MNRNLDLSRTTFGNFNLQEFANSMDENEIELNLTIVYIANMLRHIFGWINITSCYRTKEFNASVGGSSNSFHLTGKAIDFRTDFSGWTKSAVIKVLQSIVFVEYKDGDEIVHKLHNVNFYFDGERLDRIHADIGDSWTDEEFNYRDINI